MFDFLKRIKIGQIWIEKGVSPWDTGSTVKVIDYKDGWVKYALHSNVGNYLPKVRKEWYFRHEYRLKSEGGDE